MNKVRNFELEKFDFKDHAIFRMFERNISRAEVIEVVEYGEEIEDYADDYPYPSKLMFKIIQGNPIHVVVAFDNLYSKGIIITLYRPDNLHFESDFKTRIKK